MIRERWKRRSMVAFGALFLAASAISFSKGSLVMIPFGLMLVVVGLNRPSEPGSTEGVRAHGGATVFAVSSARERTAALGCAGFALGGIGFILFPEEFGSVAYIRALGIVMVLLFGAVGLLSVRRAPSGGSAVELSPRAISMRLRTGDTVVPWDAIDYVDMLEIRDQRMAALNLAHDSGVVAPGWANLLRPLSRRMGADLSIPLHTLECDPDLFYALLEHMHAHPEDRGQLADPGGPDVLRRFAV